MELKEVLHHELAVLDDLFYFSLRGKELPLIHANGEIQTHQPLIQNGIVDHELVQPLEFQGDDSFVRYVNQLALLELYALLDG